MGDMGLRYGQIVVKLMRVLSITSALIITALVVVMRFKRDPSPQVPAAEPNLATLRVTEVPREWTALSNPAPVAPAVGVVEPLENPTPTDDPEAAPEEVTDPAQIEARKKMRRQMDLRYLESSAAKNTPEAKQIEAMLAKRGISRGAIPICYGIAWNYQVALKNLGDNPVAERIALSHVRPEFEKLQRDGYGEVGEDFWQELLQIRPTVFFGEKDYNLPRPGTPLIQE
jgi:hypothetical protein